MEKLNDKWFRIIGIPMVAFLGQTLFYPDMVFSGRLPLERVYGMSIVVSILLWEFNRQILIAVRQELPGLKNTWRRLVKLFVLMAISTALISSCVVYFNNTVNMWGSQATWRTYISAYITRFSILILIAAIYESIYFFRQWRQTYRETLALKRVNLQTELDALIAQVNPHFLFHSLNSLSALIEEDKKQAVRFVDELSCVYRYLLQNTERDWVTLDTELCFVEAYLFILKIRFGEGLKYEAHIAEHCRDYQLPPLTMKVLIEDAIAHNVVSPARPLSIMAYTDLKKQLVVTHNVQHKTLLVKRRRHGLTNLAKKFQILSNRPYLIEEDDKEFSVRLPLRE